MDRRTAVMTAAPDLFSDRSFHGTPMPAVAEHAGVAAGTIYRYFPSKESLGNELYRYWKQEFAAALAGAADQPSARAGFDHYWAGLCRFATEHPTAFRFLEEHRHETYLDDESRQLAEAIDAQAAEFIRRHQRRGQLRPGRPEELVALVFGAFVGLVKAGAAGRIRLDHRRLLAAGDIAWSLIAPLTPGVPT